MKLKFTNSGKQLTEKDTEIEVKNPGILEVPEGKKVNELPQSHFEKLAKKKGLGKITKALNNLQVWNKNDDPELSKWAGNMIDKLNKKLKKDESVSKRFVENRRRPKYGYTIADYVEIRKDAISKGYTGNEPLRDFMREYDLTDTEAIAILSQIRNGRNAKESTNEAASKRGRKRSTGKSNSVASFLDRQIESGKIDEKQVTVVYDKNNNIMWLGKAGFYPLLMSNVEYRSSGYDKDHPHEFWINARSYTEPFGESYKKRLTIKESPMDYLDTNERAIVDKLEQLGYRGSKPIKFDGKLMGYWDKVYYTDKKSSSGVQIYIDPFDGSVEVQEFVNDIDEEDLTDLCPVKHVGSPNDVIKIDKWAKGIKKSSVPIVREDAFDDDWDNFTKQNHDWEDDFNAIFDKPWWGYLFHSTMTDDMFALISQNEQAVFDYGKELVGILKHSWSDDPYATERFIDSLPDNVILTNPEHDEIRFDRSQGERGMWCVDMDGGYGDTIVFNLIGDFTDRF